MSEYDIEKNPLGLNRWELAEVKAAAEDARKKEEERWVRQSFDAWVKLLDAYNQRLASDPEFAKAHALDAKHLRGE